MNTNLPSQITSIQEAKAFLSGLHSNGESYHPEDSALSNNWGCEEPLDEYKDTAITLLQTLSDAAGAEFDAEILAVELIEETLKKFNSKEGAIHYLLTIDSEEIPVNAIIKDGKGFQNRMLLALSQHFDADVSLIGFHAPDPFRTVNAQIQIYQDGVVCKETVEINRVWFY